MNIGRRASKTAILTVSLYSSISSLLSSSSFKAPSSLVRAMTSISISTSTCAASADVQPHPDRYHSIRQYLKNLTSQTTNDGIFLLDGGTGEELFRRGVPDDRKIWSANALVHPQHHDVLRDVHLSFLKSGSNAITTNSFGVTPGVGFTPDEITKYVGLSGRIARDAVTIHTATTTKRQDEKQDQTNNEDRQFVFGSLGPLVESYRADLIMPHNEGVENYQRMCKALEPYVDAFLAETMSCIDESLQVYDALLKLEQHVDDPEEKEQNDDGSDSIDSGGRRPLLISYTLNSDGDFRDSEPVCQGLKKLLKKIFEDDMSCRRRSSSSSSNNNNNNSSSNDDGDVVLLAILFNCCEPEALTKALQRIHGDDELVKSLKDHNILLGAYANRLTPVDDQHWTLESSDGPQPFRKDLDENEYWNKFVKPWIDKYDCQIVGGCCGFTPEHIRLIHTEISKKQKP